MDVLKQELERQERSAAWLARKVGYSPSLVTRILNGERSASQQFRVRAAEALGVPVVALFPDQLVAL